MKIVEGLPILEMHCMYLLASWFQVQKRIHYFFGQKSLPELPSKPSRQAPLRDLLTRGMVGAGGTPSATTTSTASTASSFSAASAPSPPSSIPSYTTTASPGSAKPAMVQGRAGGMAEKIIILSLYHFNIFSTDTAKMRQCIVAITGTYSKSRN